MNIRAITNQILVETTKPKEATKTFESSADRDPQQSSEHANQHEEKSFSEEEKNLALEHLKKHPGIKANNLSVQIEKQEEVYLVIIRDLKGDIIRRMSLLDLVQNYRLSIKGTKDNAKGGLLNKAS